MKQEPCSEARHECSVAVYVKLHLLISSVRNRL